MTQLHLNTITLDPTVRMTGTDWSAYRAHQVIWQFFGDHRNRGRDFLYRFDLVRGEPFFTALSTRPPRNLAGIWKSKTVPVETSTLSTGTRLSFALRAHPTICRTMANRNRGKRVDLILAFRQCNTVDLKETCTAWLQKKAERNGFELVGDTLRVRGWRREAFIRKARKVTIGIVDFFGELTVVDSMAMLNAITSGIGHAKGFGCGLLLTRSINSIGSGLQFHNNAYRRLHNSNPRNKFNPNAPSSPKTLAP